jgi:hypothetical protein
MDFEGILFYMGLLTDQISLGLMRISILYVWYYIALYIRALRYRYDAATSSPGCSRYSVQ